MKAYILDASALLDFAENGPGALRVEQILRGAHKHQNSIAMSLMNWGEVFYNVWLHHGEETAKTEIGRLSRLPLELVSVNEDQVLKAAEIKVLHKLSFVDCIAAALAELRNAVLVTADRDFQKLGRRIQVVWLVRS